ncbi:MAG TPA: zf-HC2 domain-containing protein, partial [Gemmatimonadales bacterium]
MKHADEGQLHAYLDGELSPAEVTELERHISVCAPCRALLTEARGFLTESDSLVLALDMPVVAKPYRAPRRVPYSTLAWAAMVVLALGTGYALRPALGPKDEGNAIITPEEPSAPIIAAAPTVSPSTDAASNTPSTPATRPERQGSRNNAKVTATPPAALASGAGASAEADGRVSAAERRVDAVAQDIAPVAQMQASPAPAPAAQAPSRLTYIDGTPVDTTATRLTFGPRTTAAPKRITLDEAVT